MYQQQELFNRTLRPTYHNTTNLQGQELEKRELKTDGQNAKILKLYQDSPYTSFTPTDVYLKFGQQWPITSVRRAISDLTKQGYLYKTEERRAGLFGDNNFAWRLLSK